MGNAMLTKTYYNAYLLLPKVYGFDLTNKDIIIGWDFIKLYLPMCIYTKYVTFTTNCDKRIVKSPIVANQKRKPQNWIKGDETITQQISYKIINTIEKIAIFTIDQEKEIGNLLQECLSENPLENWEKHKTEVKISLIDENSIIQNNPFNNIEKDLEEFKMHISELLKGEFIRTSNSKHCSYAFIVNKHSEQKRGKSRMVIDYRQLNAKAKTYSYPIPNKVLKLKQIQGYEWFSKFDCKSGFHHLKLTEDSKQYTAFGVPNGFYEWNVLPFGYKNAPGRFQAFMDKIYNKLDNCIVYIDDILIFTKTKEEHIRVLYNFIQITKENGISLSKKKTELFKNQIDFLGHQIDKGGVKMQDHIAKKIISEYNEFNTRKDLQKILGIVNQIREYIPNLANYLVPLQKKLRKDIQWSWSEEDQNIIFKIKIFVKIYLLYFILMNQKILIGLLKQMQLS